LLRAERQDPEISEHARLQCFRTYCALCVARCGAIAVVENSCFARLDPGPTTRSIRALPSASTAGDRLALNFRSQAMIRLGRAAPISIR
jgi:hypothetical protein